MAALKKIKSWIKIAVAVYIAAGLLLYFLQEKIIFHPKKLPPEYSFNFQVPFKEINLPVNNEKILNIIQFTVPDSLCRGVVLYFHGNRNNVERYAPYAANFTKNYYEVWMMDYPGFGKSTGPRTEEIMYTDAETVYRLARSRFSKDSIVLYGKSLGSGIASHLASINDCKRLLLETPYYSLDALMAHFAFMFPAKLMSKYHFPTHRFLERVEVPVHIFHGTHDRIIPFSQSKRLKEKFPATELITIKNGRHNDLSGFDLYQNRLDSLLALP
jgi:alpha-beta hydrolase superfamily lysophospholipase